MKAENVWRIEKGMTEPPGRVRERSDRGTAPRTAHIK
jgi:hypothetical protein